MDGGVKSVLTLDKIVYDKIEFQRLGFSSEKEFTFEIEAEISQKQGEEVYRVTLTLKGEKPDEFLLEIQLLGFLCLTRRKNYPKN